MFYYETAVNGQWISHTSNHKPETKNASGSLRMAHGYQRIRRIQEVPDELQSLSLDELKIYFEGDDK